MVNITKFDKNGYLIFKNFLSAAEKKIIFKAFFETLSKYLKISKSSSSMNFNNNSLHSKLINFRKKNPKKFGDMYDELNLNASFRSIFYSRKFIKMFSKILKTKKELLIIIKQLME